MILRHGEFAINGFKFGCGHVVDVATLQATSVRWRVQDQDNPVGDNLLMGRDFGDPQPIKLDLLVRGADPESARLGADEFAAAWVSSKKRGPNEKSVLEIGVGGKTLRAYGRPRDLDIDDTKLFTQPRSTGQAVFDRSDMYFYGDTGDGGGGSVPLRINPPQAAGMTFPIVFPWATLEGGRRQGIIDNAGKRETKDVTITIKGPISDPIVRGSGWYLALDTTLKYDQSVVIDVLNQTVRRNDGTSLAGALTRKSRLTNVVVPAGQSEFFFEGVDVTGSATATVTWRSAYTSLGAKS